MLIASLLSGRSASGSGSPPAFSLETSSDAPPLFVIKADKYERRPELIGPDGIPIIAKSKTLKGQTIKTNVPFDPDFRNLSRATSRPVESRVLTCVLSRVHHTLSYQAERAFFSLLTDVRVLTNGAPGLFETRAQQLNGIEGEAGTAVPGAAQASEPRATLYAAGGGSRLEIQLPKNLGPEAQAALRGDSFCGSGFMKKIYAQLGLSEQGDLLQKPDSPVWREVGRNMKLEQKLAGEGASSTPEAAKSGRDLATLLEKPIGAPPVAGGSGASTGAEAALPAAPEPAAPAPAAPELAPPAPAPAAPEPAPPAPAPAAPEPAPPAPAPAAPEPAPPAPAAPVVAEVAPAAPPAAPAAAAPAEPAPPAPPAPAAPVSAEPPSLALTPGKAEPYKSIDNYQYDLISYVGKHVTIRTSPGQCDPQTIAKIIRVFDKAYEEAVFLTGKEPLSLSGRGNSLSIAAIPPGQELKDAYAHGYNGAKGIDIRSVVFDKLCKDVKEKNQFDQTLFYEFGRNFWFCENQLTLPQQRGVSGGTPIMSTGFAIMLRLKLMKKTGVQGADFRDDVPFSQLQEGIEQAIDQYVRAGADWNSVFKLNKPIKGSPLGLGSSDLIASILLRLEGAYGESFIPKFLKAASSKPKPSDDKAALLNFVNSASEAAGGDISGWFKNKLHFPI